jgi:tetratricopeptide (TPR) repeat protein
LALCAKGIGDIHWARGAPTAAATAWEEALQVYRGKLLPTDPKRSDWNGMAGGLLHNLGNARAHAGRPHEALVNYQEAVRHQKVAFAANPDNSRQWLSNHYQVLADTLRTLRQPAEALAATRERVKLWPDQPDELVAAAGEVALCLPLLRADEKRREEAKACGDEAVALLKQAAAKGFKDADRLKKSEDLAPLRERADFQQVLADLEESNRPRPPAAPERKQP